VRWLRPLRPGTQIRVRATVLDKRASSNRPELGFVRFRYEVLDEQDAVLTMMVSPMMVARREPGAPR
jgi:acyl dehydratase